MDKLYSRYLKSNGVSIDTRSLKEEMMFIALKGDNFDADDFIDDALNAGASTVLTQNVKYINHPKCIVCNDALKTLQDLAAFHREKLKLPFIAITGTNGKTTTKELLRESLSCVGKIFATQGNLNNHIGVPLSILSIDDSYDYAIIEMGANHIGEIAELCKIAKPDFGLITNIGKAHLEGFISLEGVISAKNELYNYLKDNAGIAFVQENDLLLLEKSEGIDRTLYGQKSLGLKEIVQAKSICLSFLWGDDTDKYTVNSKMTGSYNMPNFMAAISLAVYFGADPLCVSNKLSQYQPENNRSQVQKTKSNTLIVDAYNANPSSMNLALDNFNSIKAENKMLILGDMLELGKDSTKEHEIVLQKIIDLGFENVNLIGSEFMSFQNNYPQFSFYQRIEDAIKDKSQKNIIDMHVLIKGSRGIKTEKIITLL